MKVRNNLAALCIVAVVTLTGAPWARCQITLSAGDTYTHSFEHLPITGFVVNGGPGGLLVVNDDASNNLKPGDALKFEMFEGAAQGAPVFSRTLTPESPSTDFHAYVPTAWNDLQ